MTWFKRGCFAATAMLIAVAFWLYNPLPSNPPAHELSAAAKQYRAEVIRDQWGVPHIFGERDADVSFALAYAHAEDDYETIQETLAATRGVLARYRGMDAAPTDYVVSVLSVWDIVEQRYESDVPDDVKALAEGYAAGLNLYAARHPDKTWQGLAPFKAEDVVAGFIFKTPFFYGLDKVLLSLFDENRKTELSLQPNQDGQAWLIGKPSGAELGSNAIAVRKHRSNDETTRLLINSHQPMTGPVAWYEAHLVSNEGLNIFGGLFPGTPLILHGFTKNLGWANTVNHIDLSDTYILERNPDNSMQYKLDGKWVNFEQQDVEIMVKLWGPFQYKATRPLLKSLHGPVVENKNATVALRYAGIGEVRQLEQYYRLNQATDLNSFMSAMRMNALPSINYVYADKDDNILFLHNAQYPLRNHPSDNERWDWGKDLPGDDSSLIWQGYHPHNTTPQLLNPNSGLLFNANNTPYSATDGEDNLKPSDFPRSMGLATNQTNRSHRLIELSDGSSPLSKQDVLDIKFDLTYSKKSSQVELLNKILAVDMKDDATLQKAQTQMAEWDRKTNIDNPNTAVVILTLRNILRSETPDDHSSERLRKSLSETIAILQKAYGTTAPKWGDVNRLVRGSVNMPLDGGPDILRAIYAIGDNEVQPTAATHGDTWMALVEWDAQGEMSADVLHQFGSATLDDSSPHYNDQAPLFARKEWRKAELDRAQIEKQASRRYFPNQLTQQ